MNPAFWIIAVVLLILAWFMFTPVFRTIGQFWKDMFSNAKQKMSDDESDK